MKTSAKIVIGSLLLAVSAGAPAALSHERTVRDGASDLGPSEEIPLDIKEVVQNHGEHYGSHFISFKVVMQESFDNAQLHQVDGEYHAVAIGIDLDADDAFERMLVVDTETGDGNHTPFAEMTTRRREGGGIEHRWDPGTRSSGYAKISRPSVDSLKVQFPERLLKRTGVDRFRFAVRAVSSQQQGHIVFDYAPEGGDTRGHST